MDNSAAIRSTAKTKHVNIRTSDDEYKRLMDFARFQGKTLSSFALDAMWEQIEDWEDMKAVKEYENDRTKGKIKTARHEDFMKEIGLR
jgi:uncharacterized protein (DUF1778 family)